MIDTQETGAGSYPSAPENTEYKCYELVVETSSKAKWIVYARNKEEAIEFAEHGRKDDIIDIFDIKTESITDVKEVKE